MMNNLHYTFGTRKCYLIIQNDHSVRKIWKKIVSKINNFFYGKRENCRKSQHSLNAKCLLYLSRQLGDFLHLPEAARLLAEYKSNWAWAIILYVDNYLSDIDDLIQVKMPSVKTG